MENCKADAVFSKSDALDILHKAVLEGIICVSSEAIGAMETCYKLTIEYTPVSYTHLTLPTIVSV